MWITRRGEAVLLDYGVGPPVASAFAATLEGGQQFLHHVARVGLMGWREAVPAAIERPLSFAAFDTLDRLAGAAFESFDAVRSALEALEHHPDEVSRRRRVASLLLPGLPVFFCSVAVTVILQQFLRHHRTCRWRGRYRRPAVRGADCGGRDHLDSERICEQGWRGSPVVGDRPGDRHRNAGVPGSGPMAGRWSRGRRSWQAHSSSGWALPPVTALTTVVVAFLLMLGGGSCAGPDPDRGLQDRIAGTWLVPR